MHRKLLALLILVAGSMCLLSGEPSVPSTVFAVGAGVSGAEAPKPADQPVAFVPNRGQWDGPFAYRALAGRQSLWVTPSGWVLSAAESGRGVAIGMEFEESSPKSGIEGRNRLPGVHHYFLGGDRTGWVRNVPIFDGIRMNDLYRGVAVEMRREKDRFEYDLLLQPHADLERVAVSMKGVDGIRIGEDGALLAETAMGIVRQPAPTTWMVLPDGERRRVRCNYRLLGGTRFGFDAPNWDRTLAMVIDPGIEFSHMVGSPAGQESYQDVVVTSNGTFLMAGSTSSASFPTTFGAYSTTHSGSFGGHDAVIVHQHRNGTLLFSTFLGSAGHDVGSAIDIEVNGNITVAGNTDNGNFPVTVGAYQTVKAAAVDGFVARFNPTGSTLLWSTFIGGNSHDWPRSMDVDDISGFIYVGGETWSNNYPTTAGAFDTTYGFREGFLSVLSTGGNTLVGSTYLGGTTRDQIMSVKSFATFCWVTGWTESNDFPTTANAFDTSYNFNRDAFVGLIASNGSALYSTYLGGWGAELNPAIDLVLGANSIDCVVTGITSSPNFPTTPGTYGTVGPVGQEAAIFVTRLSTTAMVWSTLVTYSGWTNSIDYVDVEVDNGGTVTIAGTVKGSMNPKPFPTTDGAYDRTTGVGPWIMRMDPAATRVLYASYHGGMWQDYTPAVALHGYGAAVIVGNTFSTTYPGYTFGIRNNFLTGLDLLPTGITKYGASTPSTVPIYAMPTRIARGGAANFSITCTNAPPNAAGFLLISAQPDVAGTPWMGATLHINTANGFSFIPVTSDAVGYTETAVPLPPAPAGTTAYCQYVWQDPFSPNVWSSNALQVVFQ